jgi:hypothetical protein
MGLAGFGLGAGARGLYGLLSLINRRDPDPKIRPAGIERIETGFPVEEDEKKVAEDTLVEQLPSESGVLAPSLPHATPTAPPMGPPAVGGDDIHLAEAKQASWLGDLLMGRHAQSKLGIPYYLAGGMSAGGGGAYGGWHAMDALLDKRRKETQEEELERAREDFQEALVSRHGKTASADNTLGEDLDRLFDALTEKSAALEKQAESPIEDAIGTLLGGYGVYGLGTGLLSGVLMYNAAKKRQRRALLEKAKEERARQKFERQPPRIEAIPSFTSSPAP